MDQRTRRRRKFLRWAMGNLYPSVWQDIRDESYYWRDASVTRSDVLADFDHRHPKAPPVNRRFRRRICRDVSWGDVLRVTLEMPNRRIARAHRGTGRYVVLCVFHDEKTPSLWLYPDGGFHCKGCSWTGDVLDFVNYLRPLRTTRDIKAFFGPLMQPLSSA